MDLEAILRFLLDRPDEDEIGDDVFPLSIPSSTTSSSLSGWSGEHRLREDPQTDGYLLDHPLNLTTTTVETALDPTTLLLNLTIFVAEQMSNGSSNLQQSPASTSRHLSATAQAIITVFYTLGIGGNVGALVLLNRGETVRNRKQTLMIRCLVWHDLLALVGSFAVMYMQLYLHPPWTETRWFCVLRVLLRTFGLSSGCVAIVMAVERWIALTRPFLYHKHVTLTRIRRAIFTLWLVVLVLVCLPFLGFGLYYESPNANSTRLNPSQSHLARSVTVQYSAEKTRSGRQQNCVRYRFGRRPCHIAYAYLMFAIGMILSCVILFCNLAVVRALCRMGRNCPARRACATYSGGSRSRVVVGQLSNSGSQLSSRERDPNADFNMSTPEEVSFAKLMIFISVFFVSGWVPQMVTIIMAQINSGKTNHPFYRIADIFMALNFTLDPVVYVLSRRPHRRGFRRVVKLLCRFCCGCFCCWSTNDLRDGSLRSSTQATAFLYKTNFISSNYRFHGGDKKLQLGDPGEELGSDRRSSSNGSRVNSSGSGGSAGRCSGSGEHLCCYHIQDRIIHPASSHDQNYTTEISHSPIIDSQRRFGRFKASKLNFCGRGATHEACLNCQTCPTCPRACPGCCHFSCGSRRHQRAQPTRYRMKYPPDDGPFPRHLRNCHSEGCGQQIVTGHHCLRKYQNSCLNDDRPVVSDFVLETRSSLYFHI